MDAIDFLISKRILVDRNLDKPFPLNLSRDCHIDSAKRIVEALDEYHKLKLKELSDETESYKSGWSPAPKK